LLSISSRVADETFFAAFQDNLVDIGESLGIVDTPRHTQPLKPSISADAILQQFVVECNPCDRSNPDSSLDAGSRSSGSTRVWLAYTLDGSKPHVDFASYIQLGPEVANCTITVADVDSTCVIVLYLQPPLMPR
jgi:hypothetical protein